jgi:hypothetical protein
MSTQARFQVTLALTDPRTGETRNMGEWDKQDGGGVDSDDNVYRASGGRRVNLGSQIDPDTITLSRLYERVRDHGQIGWLLNGVGRYRGVVTKVPTEADFSIASGTRPLVYNDVVLKRCTPPEVDSDSDDPGLLEIEFTVGQPPKSA